mgnify:CR=1 FL=1
MKAFGLPPTSPLIQKMNDFQWSYCFLNLAKDAEEDDEMFRMRAKYSGLFINPEAVKQVSEAEKSELDRDKLRRQKIVDNGGYDATDAFMAELNAAMNGEQFMELPNENDRRGNDMSSDEFLAMCIQEFNDSEENNNFNNESNNDFNNNKSDNIFDNPPAGFTLLPDDDSDLDIIIADDD